MAIDKVVQGKFKRRRDIPLFEPRSDMLKVREAAAWLQISIRTLEDWIHDGKFTTEDGLRRLSGVVRIYFLQMKQRAQDGTLMQPPPRAAADCQP